MAEYIGAAKCYPFTTIPNWNIYRDVRTDITPIYTNIQYIQCSPAVEEEEESSRPSVECEFPRKLLIASIQRPVDASFSNWIWEVWGEIIGPCRRRQKDNELDHCCTVLYCTTLYYTVMYYTVLFIGVSRVAINIYIRYGSEWVTFCCSYEFCYIMITNGWILEFHGL